MRKLEMLLGFGCCLVGLLALRMILAARPAAALPPAAPRGSPIVQEIRTTCKLPAGTVVFVVRDSEQP